MKVDINLLVILLAEIFALIVILWLAFHSSGYVTHAEFFAGIATLFAAMIAGYWSIWSRLSQISEDIGYLKAKASKIEGDVKELKSDVKYLRKRMK